MFVIRRNVKHSAVDLLLMFHGEIYFVQSFAYGNNLYYQASVTSAAEQVTTTGQETYIFNGIPDWMYEGMRTVTS